MSTHSSHVTRYSDSSLCDEICVNCCLTDNMGNLGKESDLEKPCAKPVGEGGMTLEEWEKEDKKRVARLKASMKS